MAVEYHSAAKPQPQAVECTDLSALSGGDLSPSNASGAFNPNPEIEKGARPPRALRDALSRPASGAWSLINVLENSVRQEFSSRARKTAPEAGVIPIREENLELGCATQLPHKVNASVTSQATELVCFRLGEPLALKRVAELGADPTTVAALPLGSFLSCDRIRGGKLAGRMF